MGPMSLNFNQKQTQSMKQLQRLMMSPQMQQALHLMQMPIMELSTAIDLEMEQNPVLEVFEDKPTELETPEEEESNAEKELNFNEDQFEILKRLDDDFREHFAQSDSYTPYRTQEEEKLKSFLEQSLPQRETLYEHLFQLSRETFDSDEEMAMAEVLIGYLDHDGFITNPIGEIARLHDFSEPHLLQILKEIQTFEPHGVGASSLQESLLIQLRHLNQEQSVAYRIVAEHYEDLIHNRLPEIKKRLQCTMEEIKNAVHRTLAYLDFHPGKGYSSPMVPHIVPDVQIVEEDEKLRVEVNEDYIPTLRLNRRYLKMLDDPDVSKESKEFIKNKLLSAKWLLKNIDQRNETLFRVVSYLAEFQKSYFIEIEGKLHPLTMKQVADELGVHESTVARAVAQKYLDSPKGLISLRSLFTNAYLTDVGEEISSSTVKDALRTIIDEENKKHPFSDEKLSQLLERRGIHCARRTVAKYRTQMQIGNTAQRREY
jgi:RNA polymerase sigma-54 factor